jgi:hypothetical protein
MSTIGETLKRHRVHLDAASNDLEILEVAERIIYDCTRALLEHLGEDASSLSVEQMIDHASASLTHHPQLFKTDAPLRFYSKRVSGLKQVLRDISYLKGGLDSAVGMKPLRI